MYTKSKRIIIKLNAWNFDKYKRFIYAKFRIDLMY